MSEHETEESPTDELPFAGSSDQTPRLNLVELDEADGRVSDIYDEILGTRDGEMDEEMSLNRMWMAFANEPDVLEVMWPHMRTSYRGGSLPFELKSKVSLVTATVWECEGCQFFHTDRLSEEGVDEDEIERMRDREVERSAFSEREYVVLRFTEKMAEDPHSITDEDIEELREVGLDDGQIVELVDCIALHVYTAFFQEATGVVEKGMSIEDYLGSGGTTAE
jgi:uncharacterized peroxidase-related enzyme